MGSKVDIGISNLANQYRVGTRDVPDKKCDPKPISAANSIVSYAIFSVKQWKTLKVGGESRRKAP
jgi:hypothetical protein